MTEIYNRYRPKTLKTVVGQDAAVKVVQQLMRRGVPHAVMLSGPSGCGKTTIGRILKRHLECGDGDYREVNCATVAPLDAIRGIQNSMYAAPMSGKTKVWLLDEVQSFSRAKFAQEGLLKILEDPPDHAYFVLCTTNPGKLIPTVRNRCTEIKLLPVKQSALEALVRKVAAAEGAEISDEVVEQVCECAGGSCRKSLVLLESVIGLTEEEATEALEREKAAEPGIRIAQALFNPRTTWAEMKAVLASVEEEPETLRHMVLSYGTKVLLGAGKTNPLAALVLVAFRDTFVECGRAGLALACYEVFRDSKRK
jgi:DNA polymerase III gamma/tau subunit